MKVMLHCNFMFSDIDLERILNFVVSTAKGIDRCSRRLPGDRYENVLVGTTRLDACAGARGYVEMRRYRRNRALHQCQRRREGLQGPDAGADKHRAAASARGPAEAGQLSERGQRYAAPARRRPAQDTRAGTVAGAATARNCEKAAGRTKGRALRHREKLRARRGTVKAVRRQGQAARSQCREPQERALQRQIIAAACGRSITRIQSLARPRSVCTPGYCGWSDSCSLFSFDS